MNDSTTLCARLRGGWGDANEACLEAVETIERLRADAERWQFVRDRGLVWADRCFGEGCTPGRVGNEYATQFVDEGIKRNASEAHEHYQPQIEILMTENNQLRTELRNWLHTFGSTNEMSARTRLLLEGVPPETERSLQEEGNAPLAP